MRDRILMDYKTGIVKNWKAGDIMLTALDRNKIDDHMAISLIFNILDQNGLISDSVYDSLVYLSGDFKPV
jgi:hypothetical protein